MILLATTCVVLQIVGRVILQDHPQTVERVVQREWCTYIYRAQKLEQNTYVLIDGQKVKGPEESVQLWPEESAPSLKGGY